MLRKAWYPESQPHARFPLLKLPLELRREIYQYALCPTALFAVREGLPRVRKDRGRNDFGYIISRSEGDIIEGFSVSSKTVVATPSLAIANGEISSEVVAVLSSNYGILEKTSLLGKSTESTDPAFLSLVKSGCFEFLDNSGAALSFLDNILETTLSSIRGHALISSASGLISKREHEGNVRRNDEAWGESIGGGHPGQQRAPFPAFLRHKTPRLREITLVAPIFESQWYCSFAAAEILFLFDEGYVDTVRLLFTKHVSWNYNIEEEILVRWSQYGRFMLGHTPVLNQLSNAIPEDRSVSARLSVVRQDMIPNSLDVMRLPQGVEVKAIFNLRRQSSMGVDF